MKIVKSFWSKSKLIRSRKGSVHALKWIGIILRKNESKYSISTNGTTSSSFSVKNVFCCWKTPVNALQNGKTYGGEFWKTLFWIKFFVEINSKIEVVILKYHCVTSYKLYIIFLLPLIFSFLHLTVFTYNIINFVRILN